MVLRRKYNLKENQPQIRSRKLKVCRIYKASEISYIVGEGIPSVVGQEEEVEARKQGNKLRIGGLECNTPDHFLG